MTDDEMQAHGEQLKAFVDRFDGGMIESTFYGVTHDGPSELYNVRGSTGDPYPKQPSKVLNWSQLLRDQGFTEPCYATAPLPATGKGTSHPEFQVGGHMTTDPQNHVVDGTCFLVPLCKWHNNNYDTQPFTMRSKSMVILYGYMQADTAATFLARLGGGAPFAMVYLSDEGPRHLYLAEPPASTTGALLPSGVSSAGVPGDHVLLRREVRDGRLVYLIENAQFT